MIKVLYVVSTLMRSGPINILYDVVKYLDRTRFTPYIITLSVEKAETRIKDFANLGITIKCINSNSLTWFNIGIYNFSKAIKEILPDVIHTTGIRGDFLTAFFINHNKKITSILNNPYEDYILSYGKIIGGIMCFITKKCILKFNYPVTCSKDVMEKLKINNINTNICIYNSIDLEYFSNVSDKDILDVRLDLQIPNGAVVFTFVGVLSGRKMPDVAVAAFNEFYKINNNSFLLLIGDGELMPMCHKLANNNPNIKFLGFAHDVRKYLAITSYYIATSKAEGLPISVLEALAMKVPVILSDIKPHQEILDFDLNAGELCLTNSVQSTLQSMQKIVIANRESKSIAAHGIIEKHLNAKNMSMEYQKLYNQ